MGSPLCVTAWFQSVIRHRLSAQHVTFQAAISHLHPDRYRSWNGLGHTLGRTCMAAQIGGACWFPDTDHFAIGNEYAWDIVSPLNAIVLPGVLEHSCCRGW